MTVIAKGLRDVVGGNVGMMPRTPRARPQVGASGVIAGNVPVRVIQSITVTPANRNTLVGGTRQYTATAHYDIGADADVTALVSWSSSNLSKATIAASGVLTGVARSGSTPFTITATLGAFSGSVSGGVGLLDFKVLSPANSLAPRREATMVTLANGDISLLAGNMGSGGGSTGTAWDERRWDGSDWSSVTVTTGSPPGTTREGAFAVYDSTRDRIVVTDGNTTGAIDATTCQETATRGSWLTAMSSGWALASGAAAFDPVRGKMICYAGRNYNTGVNTSANLKEFDGTTWTTPTPTGTTPPSIVAPAGCWDAKRGEMVIFGGYNGTSLTSATYTYNGTTFTTKSPAHSPSARVFAVMSWDPDREVCVMYGGDTGSIGNEIWEWDGTDWSQVTISTPTTTPPNMQSAGIAWDEHAGTMLIATGYSPTLQNTGSTYRYGVVP